MQIKENHPLKAFNTFGIKVNSRYFIELHSIEEICEFLAIPSYKNVKKMVLGGGSNVVFTKDFDGIILKNNIKGISQVNEDRDYYYVKAGAGENWHQFVLYCIEHHYAGIENLSLIPGNVGAGPMQNIGAYGVELKDSFHTLEALNLSTGALETFDKAACEFGYRESIFKHKAKEQYIIVSVTFRLNKIPIFNTSYGAIEKELEAMGVKTLSIEAISNAVCRIRSSKLPDPSKIGNAGSFFKNPVISNQKYEALKLKFPDIIGHKNSPTETKVAAGWLIEKCNWKGQRFGDAGVHQHQALVLVNYNTATGSEIIELAQKIMLSVKEKFDIELEREVNII